MRVLALDTTTRAGSVAVIDDERVLVEMAGDGTRSHGERLPGELLQALSAAGLTTADVDLFAVASGPGSFTGLRIGIAAIQGLAFVHGRRVASISALRALAEAGSASLQPGARVGAWMDAYRGEIFSALYAVSDVAPGSDGATGAHVASGFSRTSDRIIEIEEPMVGSPDATLARWGRLGLPGTLCGDGAVKHRALVPSSIAIVEPPPLAAIVARLALDAFAEGETIPPAGVQPLYVRRPDAELAREAAARRP